MVDEQPKKEMPKDLKMIEPTEQPVLDFSSPKKICITKDMIQNMGRCFIEPGRVCLLPEELKNGDYSNYCRACVERMNTIQMLQLQATAMGQMTGTILGLGKMSMEKDKPK